MSLVEGQCITLIISILGFVVWIIWMKQNPAHRLARVGIVPLAWFAHNSILYIFLIFLPTKLSPYQYAVWSQVARLHILFTLAFIGYTLLNPKGKQNDI